VKHRALSSSRGCRIHVVTGSRRTVKRRSSSSTVAYEALKGVKGVDAIDTIEAIPECHIFDC